MSMISSSLNTTRSHDMMPVAKMNSHLHISDSGLVHAASTIDAAVNHNLALTLPEP